MMTTALGAGGLAAVVTMECDWAVTEDRQARRAPRALIDESITPVRDANHVWLIFNLVIFSTAFPRARSPR